MLSLWGNKQHVFGRGSKNGIDCYLREDPMGGMGLLFRDPKTVGHAKHGTQDDGETHKLNS